MVRGEASERIFRGEELVCEVHPPETVWDQSPPTRDGNKVVFKIGQRGPARRTTEKGPVAEVRGSVKNRLMVLSREPGGEWRASWPCMEGVNPSRLAAISEGPVLSILGSAGAGGPRARRD